MISSGVGSGSERPAGVMGTLPEGCSRARPAAGRPLPRLAGRPFQQLAGAVRGAHERRGDDLQAESRAALLVGRKLRRLDVARDGQAAGVDAVAAQALRTSSTSAARSPSPTMR